MKMTRLEWRYLQRIALDHPYFDTHKLPLTEQEAKAIVEANIKMTGKEFVDSIYAKLGMARPEEKKERFAWLRNIGELFTVPPIRKIAIAVLVVVLMTVFFAATPTGRAIAESVIQYIATLFEDGRLVVKQSENRSVVTFIDNGDKTGDGEQNDGESSILYVQSVDEFTRAMKRTPVILPLPYTELYYIFESDIDYLEFHSIYNTMDGTIVTYQIWDVEDWAGSSSTGFTAFDTDQSLYYSIEDDGSIIVVKVFEDSIFSALAKSGYTLDDLVKLLNMGLGEGNSL